MSRDGPLDGPKRTRWLVATHWDTLSTARSPNDPSGEKARQLLCKSYWQAVYHYIRSHAYSERQAQDLTKEFFNHLISRRPPNVRRGKFRTFLLEVVENFLFQVRSKKNKPSLDAHCFISPEEFAEEEHLELKLAEPVLPEQVFERRWALRLSEHAVSLLREEYYEMGKGQLYEALKDFEPGRAGYSTEELEKKFGLSVPALHAAARKMHRRYVQILRKAVSATVGSNQDLEDEVRHLIAVLGKLDTEN